MNELRTIEQLLVRLIHHLMQCSWCQFELHRGTQKPQLCQNGERLWKEAGVPDLPPFESIRKEDLPMFDAGSKSA